MQLPPALCEGHRQEILRTMPERIDFAARGFGFQVAELAAARNHLQHRVQAGDQQAMGQLDQCQRTTAQPEHDPSTTPRQHPCRTRHHQARRCGVSGPCPRCTISGPR